MTAGKVKALQEPFCNTKRVTDPLNTTVSWLGHRKQRSPANPMFMTNCFEEIKTHCILLYNKPPAGLYVGKCYSTSAQKFGLSVDSVLSP